jgi:hypothetical protein
MLRSLFRIGAGLLVLCVSGSPALAGRSLTLAPSHALALRLELHQPTLLVLPEPIDSVLTGPGAERFQTDTKGAYLGIVLRDASLTDGRFFVLGASGTPYLFTYKVGAPGDDVVHILAPAPPAAKAQPFSLFSFFRYLREGKAPPGAQPMTLPLAQSPDPRVQVVQSSAVLLGDLVGLTLVLRNLHPTPLAVDVRVGLATDPTVPDTLFLGTWPWPAQYRPKAIAEADPLWPDQDGPVFVLLEKR